MSSTFADLGVSEPVAGALAKRGIETPFAVQSMVVPDVLDGHDVLVKSPTGSGKTLAFGVPLADRLDSNGAWPSALILAPTRELAAQIVDELAGVMHARALKITAVYGGVGIHNQAKQAVALARARRHARPPDRPDRARRRRPRRDRGARPRRGRPHARHGLQARRRPDRRHDAARPPDAALLGHARGRGRPHRLRLHARRRAATSTPPAPEKVGHIEHRFHRVAHEAKVSALVHELGDPKRGLTLVFVRTKRGADRLVKRLGAQNVAGRRHARRQVAVPARAARSRASRRARSTTLVATDVAARGIDVAGVTHVINYDAPGRARGLRAPHRPHRPRGRQRRRHHVRARRPGPRRRQVRRRARASSTASASRRRRRPRRAAPAARRRQGNGNGNGAARRGSYSARPRRRRSSARSALQQLRLRRRELSVGEGAAPAELRQPLELGDRVSPAAADSGGSAPPKKACAIWAGSAPPKDCCCTSICAPGKSSRSSATSLSGFPPASWRVGSATPGPSGRRRRRSWRAR